MNENNERWMGESVRNVQKRESGVSTKQMNLLLNNAGNSGDHMGMIEDDYDRDAYESLLFHLRSGGVQVYGKGIHGRHNDNSAGIVNWFSSQLKQILREDFQRKADE